MPVPPADGPVTSPYGPRKGSEIGPGVGPFHYGSDRIGKGNRSPEAGTIVFAGYAGAFGNAILVRAGRVVWNIAHHKNLNGRARGQRVAENEDLAPQGATGLAFGVHTHGERRVDGGDTIQSGTATDPELYFTALAAGGSKPFEPEDEMNAEQEAILKEVARRQTVEPPIRSRVIRNTKTGDIVMLHPAGVALIGDELIPSLADANGAAQIAGQPKNEQGTYWIDLPNEMFTWEKDRHEQLLAAMDKRIRGLLGPTLSDEQVRDISRIAGEGAEAGARAAIDGATATFRAAAT